MKNIRPDDSVTTLPSTLLPKALVGLTSERLGFLTGLAALLFTGLMFVELGIGRPQVFGPFSVPEFDVQRVPTEQGIYIITSQDKTLYVGEAKSLRARLKKHLDHSDNKFLARYLWESGSVQTMIEYHVLPAGTRTDVRRAMELELIRSRRAEFNVRR